MAVEITSFRALEKNTLKGFVTARMTNIGLEIRDMALHEKNGDRWLSMPGKPYEKDGETSWVNIIYFYDKDLKDRFQKAALEAFDAYQQNAAGDTGYPGF